MGILFPSFSAENIFLKCMIESMTLVSVYDKFSESKYVGQWDRSAVPIQMYYFTKLQFTPYRLKTIVLHKYYMGCTI